MFEATLTLTAVVVANGNGESEFQVFERQKSKQDFLSILAMTYYQDVYRLLQAEDTLTVTLRTDNVERIINARFQDGSEDYTFNETGYSPTVDLFPRIEEMYQEISSSLRSGNTLSIAFYIRRS